MTSKHCELHGYHLLGQCPGCVALARIEQLTRARTMHSTDTPHSLSNSERDLLRWLGKEDFSQYGECYGRDLDALVAKGLAQVHAPGEHQVFIAKGSGPMFRAVSLTDAGVAALEALTRADE